MKLILIILLAISPLASAKRKAPAPVTPVVIENITISAPHFNNGTKGGILRAHDTKSKELLWQINVYQTDYNKALESDVQDIFIKTLSYDKTHHLLILSDEKDRTFIVDIKSKSVTQIKKS